MLPASRQTLIREVIDHVKYRREQLPDVPYAIRVVIYGEDADTFRVVLTNALLSVCGEAICRTGTDIRVDHTTVKYTLALLLRNVPFTLEVLDHPVYTAKYTYLHESVNGERPTFLFIEMVPPAIEATTFSERVRQWRRGEIRFFQDLILSQDLIAKHRERLNNQ